METVILSAGTMEELEILINMKFEDHNLFSVWSTVNGVTETFYAVLQTNPK